MITWMLIVLGVCLCLCLPFLRILSVLIHHCRVNRALKVTSSLCPPPFGPPAILNDAKSSPEDHDDPPVSMETYWKSMHEEAKHEVEEAKHEAEETKDKLDEDIKE